jgi:hypothetical protein
MYLSNYYQQISSLKAWVFAFLDTMKPRFFFTFTLTQDT